MAQWRPDPTFYPSPRMAMEAPLEKFAYVMLLNPRHEGQHDALAVVDVDPSSSKYGQVVGRLEMPNSGDDKAVNREGGLREPDGITTKGGYRNAKVLDRGPARTRRGSVCTCGSCIPQHGITFSDPRGLGMHGWRAQSMDPC